MSNTIFPPGTRSYFEPVTDREEVWLKEKTERNRIAWLRCLTIGMIKQCESGYIAPVTVQRCIQEINTGLLNKLRSLFSSAVPEDSCYIPTASGILGDEFATMTQTTREKKHLVWGDVTLENHPEFEQISRYGEFSLVTMMGETNEENDQTVVRRIQQTTRDKEQKIPVECREKTAKWLYSALPVIERALRNKNLMDILSIAALLDTDEQRAFAHTIRTTNQKIGSWSYDEAVALLEHINEYFLRPRGAMLYLHPKGGGMSFDASAQEMWGCDCNSFELVTSYHYTTHHGNLPVYVIRNMDPKDDADSQYSTSIGAVLFNIRNIQEREKFVRQSTVLPSDVIKESLRNAFLAAFGQYVNGKYTTDHELQSVLSSRTLTEEVRHGIDHLHGRGKSVCEMVHGILNRELGRSALWRAYLSYGGRLSPHVGSELQAAAIIETSGYMTAAAVGPDTPHYVILQWRCELESLSLGTEQAIIYHLAATYGCLLLAKTLDLASARTLPSIAEIATLDGITNFYSAPFISELIDCCNALLSLQPEKLRLALKEVYAREFTAAIDEDPFPKISDDGSLSADPIGKDIISSSSALDG